MDGPHKGWDSAVHGVGRQLHRLQLDRLDLGWERLPDMPGTHRSHHAVAAAGGRLYVFGGVASAGGEDPRHWNTVDTWCFTPQSREWRRLRDLPFPCGGWTARVFRDRYILLFGGYVGRDVLDPDGSVRPSYGCPGAEFSNRVLVYDPEANAFSETDPMPAAINDTRLVWVGNDRVMNITGEIPGGRRIPCVLVGRVSLRAE
jgi:N-acetylneuraminic acid mutarotase